MNQTPAINIWKGNNRVSQLWVDLLDARVSPDPCAGEYPSSGVIQELSFPLESWEMEEHSFASGGGQNHSAVPALLEKAGFKSLRLFRQALEALTAPPDDEPAAGAGLELDLRTSSPGRGELEKACRFDAIQADPALTLGMTFVKVSSEPEPQPGSTIDTRRMAYGLKIPGKPLHKRPVYQRIFFCLHHMIRPGRDDPSSHR